MNALPTIQWNGKRWIVDFRLAELRTANPPLETVPFTELRDEQLKASLRGLRFRTWHSQYIKGLDD